MRQQDKYYKGERHQTALGSNHKFESEYDFPSGLIQYCEGDNFDAVYMRTLSLATAQVSPLLISSPGYGFVLFGHDGDSIKTVDTSVFVNIGIQKVGEQATWPGKHNRPFRGYFTKLFLTWPAQEGAFADLVIFKFSEMPVFGGESAT